MYTLLKPFCWGSHLNGNSRQTVKPQLAQAQALALAAATLTPGSRYRYHLLLVFFSSQMLISRWISALLKMWIVRNATGLRSGATLATTTTTHAGTETTVSSRFVFTNSLQRQKQHILTCKTILCPMTMKTHHTTHVGVPYTETTCHRNFLPDFFYSNVLFFSKNNGSSCVDTRWVSGTAALVFATHLATGKLRWLQSYHWSSWWRLTHRCTIFLVGQLTRWRRAWWQLQIMMIT